MTQFFLFFVVLDQLLLQEMSFLNNLSVPDSKLSEKKFLYKFAFFNGFTQNPQPLNDQDLPSMMKVFFQYSLTKSHMLFKFFKFFFKKN